MLDQLDANFRNLSNTDIIVKVGAIADALTNHPGFPLPWPDVVPDPDRLKELVAGFKNAVNAAANGDRQKISERALSRAELVQSTTLTAQYLVMKSIKERDLGRLFNTGFDLKKRTYNRSASSNAILSSPANFSVKHGPLSGTLIAKSSRVPGAATYELHMCQGDPTVEESWTTLGHFVHCSRMEVKDLEPGKRFNFRVRCLGANGPGPWSSIFSLMVL